MNNKQGTWKLVTREQEVRIEHGNEFQMTNFKWRKNFKIFELKNYFELGI